MCNFDILRKIQKNTLSSFSRSILRDGNMTPYLIMCGLEISTVERGPVLAPGQ